MNKDAFKNWMEVLLKRFAGDWAMGQVAVDIVADKEAGEIQVDYIMASGYVGFFHGTKFMELITQEIENATKTGRLDAMNKITVVIRQDRTFDMAEIKEEDEARRAKRRKRAAADVGRDTGDDTE